MKSSSFLLAAALLFPAAGAFAQSSAARQQASSLPLVSAAAGPVLYTRNIGSGSITYFGTVCSHDAGHAQFAQLRQAFAASKPTVVFFENPDCGIDSTETATIGRLGEGAYVRFLAQQQQVPVERFDRPAAEYEYLQARIDPERLKLFCLLREAQRYQARTGASRSLTTKAVQQLIANSAIFLPGTGQAIHNVAEFETAYRKYCPDGGKWWQAPAAWFNPSLAAAGTGSPLIKEVNAATAAFREGSVYRDLTERARAGQRVFVAVDRDHLPAQAPALARN